MFFITRISIGVLKTKTKTESILRSLIDLYSVDLELTRNLTRKTRRIFLIGYNTLFLYGWKKLMRIFNAWSSKIFSLIIKLCDKKKEDINIKEKNITSCHILFFNLYSNKKSKVKQTCKQYRRKSSLFT